MPDLANSSAIVLLSQFQTPAWNKAFQPFWLAKPLEIVGGGWMTIHEVVTMSAVGTLAKTSQIRSQLSANQFRDTKQINDLKQTFRRT